MPKNDLESIRVALLRISGRLPKSLGNRFQNSIDHFERAKAIFGVDREMASFRAITGEEEAATALMRAIKLRPYDASWLNVLRHHHKAAVVGCVYAVGDSVRPILGNFQLTFDFSTPRIDVKIPLSNFGVSGGGELALQPVEPLNFIHSREGVSENDVFDAHLLNVTESVDLKELRKLINARANQRNKLLYASDDGVPQSQATVESINQKYWVAMAMLIAAVMVYQTPDETPLIRQSLQTLAKVI